jgi:NAD(P)-dependent dehydrogenase (short-subunit alcohol dehydrogenase family)
MVYGCPEDGFKGWKEGRSHRVGALTSSGRLLSRKVRGATVGASPSRSDRPKKLRDNPAPRSFIHNCGSLLEEIAPASVFLAAPSCSSYITGEVLPIIGGYSGG